MNYKILSGVLVLCLVYDAVVEIRNMKKFKNLNENLKASEETVHYLAGILDENDYDLTEFDKLALTAIRD